MEKQSPVSDCEISASQGEYEFSPEILSGKLAEVVYRDAAEKIKGKKCYHLYPVQQTLQPFEFHLWLGLMKKVLFYELYHLYLSSLFLPHLSNRSRVRHLTSVHRSHL